MNKYKINYSVTIEAGSQQDAVNIFFESVPQNGVMQCSVFPDDKNIYDLIKSIENDIKKAEMLEGLEESSMKKK